MIKYNKGSPGRAAFKCCMKKILMGLSTVCGAEIADITEGDGWDSE